MAMLYQPVCHGVLCAVRRAGAKDQGVAGRCCCCGKEGSEAQAGDQEGLREVTDVRTHAYGSFVAHLAPAVQLHVVKGTLTTVPLIWASVASCPRV